MSKRLTRLNLAGMLAMTIGLEKAQQVVDAAAQDQGLQSGNLTQDEAKRVLSKVAETPGLIGMAATLAKSRLHFVAAASRLKSSDAGS